MSNVPPNVDGSHSYRTSNETNQARHDDGRRDEQIFRDILKHLLFLTSNQDSIQRRSVIVHLTNIQLDVVVGRLWEQGLSRKVRERVRLDLDEYRPWLDAETREWLLGNFAKLNEEVGWLWQQDDDEFQGRGWTRVTVLEMLLDDYVAQDRRDHLGFIQRAAAEKSVTLPAAVRIMSRIANVNSQEVLAWKARRVNGPLRYQNVAEMPTPQQARKRPAT